MLHGAIFLKCVSCAANFSYCESSGAHHGSLLSTRGSVASAEDGLPASAAINNNDHRHLDRAHQRSLAIARHSVPYSFESGEGIRMNETELPRSVRARSASSMIPDKLAQPSGSE